jgi:tRNA1Val (adenine37-N6)-methyltransferase
MRGAADLVVANPPFYSDQTHTAAANRKTRAAKTGHHDDSLREFVVASRNLLGRSGRACFVWPAQDAERLFFALQGVGMSARRAKLFYPTATSPARRILVEARAGSPGGLSFEPPLIQFEQDGGQTDAFHSYVELRNAVALESGG